ncbi:uncharacterized protein LOC113559839 isoform X2 [Rhopalosiphum maidis]|uniref:uncharacterized protein LOC113559839 isoform X2 n=1 Tax=Rhopalosiphum maidis TaxID=43146 RepID=UPI000EFEB249|nr:uncharacterized protein LOC113559839 isoform X2 [Rhopalosiphum maidis]
MTLSLVLCNVALIMNKRPEDGAFTKARKRLSVTTWATPIFIAQTSTGATSVKSEIENESTSTQTVPDITTSTSTPGATENSISTTTGTTPLTYRTSTDTTATDSVSMPKPFVHRNDELWGDDEERERRQQRFSLIYLDDFVRMGENDYRRRYGLRVIQGRPWLLRGAGQGPLALYERGEELYTPLFTVMLIPSNLDNPNEGQEFLHGDPLNLNRNLPLDMHADNIAEMLRDRILQMQHFTINDQATVDAIQRLRNSMPSQDSYNWILLIVIIATMHPHPNDPPVVRFHPGRLSISRAARMLVGPRGIVHGWAGSMPNIMNALQEHGEISSFMWSHRCTIDAETDGGSSFDSDSVGYESDSWKSGPRGVARGRPPVTGMSSLSDTSSVITSDNDIIHGLNMGGNPDDVEGCFKLKRFKGYMKRSAVERRERRAMRRARRMTRNNYDWQRRLNDPAYDMEARRAEILAAEGLRNESRAQEMLNAERKTERVLHWCQSQQAVLAGMDSQLAPSEEQIDYRLKDLKQSLYEQVSHTWAQFYGDQIAAQATPEEIDQMVFYCWMTPTRWIRQTGPNCGLAVLAMAARPILTCEAAMGNFQDEDDQVVEKAFFESSEKEQRKAERSTDNTTYPPENYVPSLADFQREAIRSGYSGRGEMFSTQAMVNLATTHKTGRYNVTLVKRDLLDMTEELNKDDIDTKPEIIRSVVEKVEDLCIGPANLNTDGVINEVQQNFDPDTRMSESENLQSSSSALNVVQRLMRGHLIAVCFDCDRNMMPSSTDGGSTAHWALLCGVIIGKSHKRPQKIIQQYNDEISDTLKYGYLYAYDPSMTEFIPTGYIDRRMLDTENPNGRTITRSSRSYMQNINVNNADIAEEDYDDGNLNITEEARNFKYCDLSDQDLEQNADRVWVVARHGKIGGRYAVWSLKELAKSNCQLRKPADKILRSIPPEIKMLWNNGQQPLDCITANSISIAYNYDSTNYCNLRPTQTDNTFQRLESTYAELPVEYWPEENTENPVLDQIQTEEPSLPLSTIQTPPKIQLPPLPQHIPPPPPPPPPQTILPPPPTTSSMFRRSRHEDYDEPPFVLPEGPRLDLCLAHQFISFEPVRAPNIISDENNPQTLNPLSTLLCHFSFNLNHDLNKFNLTRNAIERWPRHYRQLSDSSSESSTSPERQPTRSRAQRRRQGDHRANREGIQSCRKEYPVQSKLAKQTE